MSKPLLVSCVLAIVLGSVAHSQERPRTLRVVLVDSVSQEPIRRPSACIRIPTDQPRMFTAHCARADSTGQLVFDSLPSGRLEVMLRCDTGPLFGGEDLGHLVMGPTDSGGDHGDRMVVGHRCDQRPFVTERGVFQGFWVAGFEESGFITCRVGKRFETWVEFARHVSIPTLPKTIELSEGYSMWWVRFLGVRVGPYHYGHLGVADWRLSVDSILELRPVRKSDCGGWRPRPFPS